MLVLLGCFSSLHKVFTILGAVLNWEACVWIRYLTSRSRHSDSNHQHRSLPANHRQNPSTKLRAHIPFVMRKRILRAALDNLSSQQQKGIFFTNWSVFPFKINVDFGVATMLYYENAFYVDYKIEEYSKIK